MDGRGRAVFHVIHPENSIEITIQQWKSFQTQELENMGPITGKKYHNFESRGPPGPIQWPGAKLQVDFAVCINQSHAKATISLRNAENLDTFDVMCLPRRTSILFEGQIFLPILNFDKRKKYVDQSLSMN